MIIEDIVINIVLFKKGEPSVMSLVVSDSNNLLIYEGSKLKWGAQLHPTPVAICRAALEVYILHFINK